MYENNNEVIILPKEQLTELISELGYLRIVINNEIKPTSKSLKNINKNLQKTVDNFDEIVKVKASKVLDRISIDTIQEEVIMQVVKQFNTNIKEVNKLSELSSHTQKLIKEFHRNYNDIEQILDTYESRLKKTTILGYFINAIVITMAFFAGALYLPFLYKSVVNLPTWF